jgi:two-component system NarL family response regulator
MEENYRIRILIADDHFVVRMGLAALINSQPDMEVVAEAGNGRQAIDLFREHQPDVILMDLRMPVMPGLDATRSIMSEFPDARIVVLTTYDGDEDIYRALQAGAKAYLLKDVLGDGLLAAIREVHAGRRHLPSNVAARLAGRLPLSTLTSRELEVLELIAKGMTNRDIAAALGISNGTVKIHVNNILSKLGVSDRTQATATALQRGIVHLD